MEKILPSLMRQLIARIRVRAFVSRLGITPLSILIAGFMNQISLMELLLLDHAVE